MPQRLGRRVSAEPASRAGYRVAVMVMALALTLTDM